MAIKVLRPELAAVIGAERFLSEIKIFYRNGAAMMEARSSVAPSTPTTPQERAAREEFGMIRDGEILYRLVPQRP